MKECSKCLLVKSIEDFYSRKRGPRAGEFYEKCKECMRARGRIYYAENRERQLELALLRKRKYVSERKEYIYKFKQKPCMDCGKIYPPWVMDFDHREGTEKIVNIGKIYSGKLWSLDKIDKEIEKCDLVCANNCHRIRTYERLTRNKDAKIA